MTCVAGVDNDIYYISIESLHRLMLTDNAYFSEARHLTSFSLSCDDGELRNTARPHLVAANLSQLITSRNLLHLMSFAPVM